MKQILKTLGINAFIALKVKFNESIGENKFYISMPKRLKQTHLSKQDYAQWLISDLHYHWKEYSQYQ